MAQKILDKALFEKLFKSHFVHLCNFANQYVNETDNSKDIVQKVFIRLWESRDKINPAKPIQSYLFTAVKNRCLNHIRDQKKYRSRVLDLEISDLDVSFETEDDSISELRLKINEALDELPEKCRIVFEMSRFRNMKYKDIALELDVSVKTVEAHMSKALKTLRAQLKDYMHMVWIFFDLIN